MLNSSALTSRGTESHSVSTQLPSVHTGTILCHSSRHGCKLAAAAPVTTIHPAKSRRKNLPSLSPSVTFLLLQEASLFIWRLSLYYVFMKIEANMQMHILCGFFLNNSSMQYIVLPIYFYHLIIHPEITHIQGLPHFFLQLHSAPIVALP